MLPSVGGGEEDGTGKFHCCKWDKDSVFNKVGHVSDALKYSNFKEKNKYCCVFQDNLSANLLIASKAG